MSASFAAQKRAFFVVSLKKQPNIDALSKKERLAASFQTFSVYVREHLIGS